MMKKSGSIQYYNSLEDDFIQTSEQDYRLPCNYSWEDPADSGLLDSIASKLAYGIALVFGWAYTTLVLHAHFVGREKLRSLGDGTMDSKEGFILYCNHTQPLGDPFLPGLAAFPKRIWTIVSPSNLGIPRLGKILPMLGALPIPDSVKKMKRFSSAVKERLRDGDCVVVYPEAHVWPYCTFIRPFPATSFSYAVTNNVPVFSMTATYQKRIFGRRPKMTLFIDGPFLPNESLPRAERKEYLCQQVRSTMEARSQLNTQSFIEYRDITFKEERS